MNDKRNKVEYYKVDDEQVKNLIDTAFESGIEIDRFEGSLLDNYIIYNDSCIELENITSKYILILERYLNQWSSCYDIVLTDNDQQVEEYLKIFDPENY